MRLAFAAILTAAMLAVAVTTYQTGGGIPSYTFIVSFGAFACSALLLASHVRRRAADRGEMALLRIPPLAMGRLAAFGAVWLAYVLVLSAWGFMLPTWLALFLSLAILHGRPTLRAGLGTAMFVLVFAVLMKTVLYVPVPQGPVDEYLDEILYSIL